MATHTRRETTVRRVDHVLPVPSNSAELRKAVSAAERHYRETHDFPPERSIADNALTVTVTDDEILISYEVTE